ncbi:unnamed protein product [Trifolium pratense]|uniref:Uncharacterized protein n=1 Tax=Trifolium pratense TaxID=57577 RepID=A0ACB0J833_TRIPR|nr:unnamed protein product [Trifolium pratense]
MDLTQQNGNSLESNPYSLEKMSMDNKTTYVSKKNEHEKQPSPRSSVVNENEENPRPRSSSSCAFHAKKWDKFTSDKVATLAYAQIQGKAEELAKHFEKRMHKPKKIISGN